MKRPSKRKTRARARRKGAIDAQQREFNGAKTNRLTSTWLLSGLSADAEIRDGLFALRNRCRDLERNNDYMRGFGEDIEANTIGSEGVVFQSKVTEEADRIVTDPTEKAFIKEYERIYNERRELIRKKLIARGVREDLVNQHFANRTFLHSAGNRGVKVLKGQPDVYAIDRIEKAYERAGRKENFTVTRAISRLEGEKLWLRSTWRDGACLVREVKGFPNEFGYALEFIDIDWLDLNYSAVLPNGNEVRMGKEFNKWKECVAYHILIRRPGDWQASMGSYSGGIRSGKLARERIDAKEIHHGFIRERIDQSREIPWIVSGITRLQMLGKWEEAALMASLLSARKTGTWYSDLFSDQMTLTKNFQETGKGEFEEATEPGQDTIAPYGWKYQVNDPKWPLASVGEFRKVMLQGIAAGMPGSSYHRISQDPSGLSFSNLRGVEIQSRESWKMIQAFMRENFHMALFPNWLESALMSKQVPLPVSRIEKYNKAAWIFRRWQGVDPTKEADANRMNLLLANTTRTKISAEAGGDFYENLEQLILEEDAISAAGLDALLLVNLAAKAPAPAAPEKKPGEDDPGAEGKPAKGDDDEEE